MSDWVVGAEVIEQSSSWGAFPYYGRSAKIGKVYKNGNFVLEGDAQQWSPRSGYASQTGTSRSSKTLVLLNDATRAEMELAQRYSEARAAVKKEAARLEKLWRHGDVDEVIAEAAQLKERSK